MILTTKNLWRLAVLLAVAAPALAEDKSRYGLLDPTPRERMRPLSADRPDATESPYTVDAGRFQLEADVAAYLRDVASPDGTSTHGWAFAITNLKAGLTHRLDVQLVIETFRRERSGGGGVAEGFGDLTLRGKLNLWGNDGGETAFAVLPFVKFPTAEDGLGNDSFEGGFVTPLAVALPHGLGLGAQVGLEAVRNGRDTTHKVDVVATVVLSREIGHGLGAFVEVASRWPGESGVGWIGTLDGGFTYAVTDDLQLDLAAFVGLSRPADDLVVFLGVTKRF